MIGQLVSLGTVHHAFDWRHTLPYLAGAVIGVPLGIAALTAASPLVIKIAVGTFLVAYSLYQLIQRKSFAIGQWGGKLADSTIGLGGGVLGGFAGLSGPLPLIWLQLRGGPSDRQRATYQPFNLVVLYSGLQAIPSRIHEAAELDGATGWQRFWMVTFPLLRPVSAITLLLGLVYTLKVFDIIWIMTKGGPSDASTTLATWSYRLGFGNLLPSFGPGAAVGNLLIVIALVFGLVYIRAQRRQGVA